MRSVPSVDLNPSNEMLIIPEDGRYLLGIYALKNASDALKPLSGDILRYDSCNVPESETTYPEFI
jgi:hypothetical protein